MNAGRLLNCTRLSCTEEAIALGCAIARRPLLIAVADVLREVKEDRCHSLTRARRLEEAMQAASQSGLWREVVEAATMTGGIGDCIGNSAATAAK